MNPGILSFILSFLMAVLKKLSFSSGKEEDKKSLDEAFEKAEKEKDTSAVEKYFHPD